MSEAHGFDKCAVARVEEIAANDRLRQWLDRGMHGSMEWMARTAERRSDPRRVVAGARSIVVVALSYHTRFRTTHAADEGCISRYAWGDEYHEVLGARLEAMWAELRRTFPGVEGRWYVDTGPVLEKAWAEQSGLGWIGKHTNVISRDAGSWIFLGVVVLDLEIEGGRSHRDYCGTCKACIDICPTDAIVAPYVLDARRCISYLTIENRGEIPRAFRAPMGNRVFGCDDCQDVCPWNRFARVSAQAQAFAPSPGNQRPRLRRLLLLTDEEFRKRFAGSPVLRAKRRGFVRNVAVALGNSRDPDAVPDLRVTLTDGDALVRGHVSWALGEIGGAAAESALRQRRREESDGTVRHEIDAALETIASRR